MRMVAIVMASFLWPGSVRAQPAVSVDVRNGNMTLVATGATLEHILAEWSRVGNVEVTMRGEGLSRAPITLLLRDLTEREALDILLREVGGYLLVARQNPAAGRSAFERILIVPAQGDATLFRERPDATVARAPRVRAPVEARDGDGIDLVSTPSFSSSAPVRSEPAAGDAPEPFDEIQERAGAPAGGVGTAAPTVPGPPPTPLLPPTPATRAVNPFGVAAGSDRPGVLMPSGGPPPGVVYPPVTNPNLERRPFTPGTVPADTTTPR